LTGMNACASAQSAEVRIQVHPMADVQYILDGKERLKATQQWLRLPTGRHSFSFWAPGFSIWDTTLTVAAGDSVLLRRVLRSTPEFRAHQKAESRVVRSKFLWKAIPLAAMGVFGVLTHYARRPHDEAYEELQRLRASYPTLMSRSDIAHVKDVEIPEMQDRLADTRRVLVLNGALTCVSALAAVYGFHHAKRIKAPAYEDKERLRFEGLTWRSSMHGGHGMLGMQLTWR
jgi:hypothetical protein